LTHVLLSGAKANYTYFVIDCCEWARLSCGGHGFAHYSGLPDMFFNTSPNITLEGENKVMYLQLARFIIKTIK
jgi:acyl-CoA oxidase